MPNMNTYRKILFNISKFENATRNNLIEFTLSKDLETRDLYEKLNNFVNSPQFQTMKEDLSDKIDIEVEEEEIDVNVEEAESIKKSYANKLWTLWSDNQMTKDDMTQLRNLVQYHNFFTRNAVEDFMTFIELNAPELEKEPKDASEQPKEQQEENKQENIEEKVNKNIDEEEDIIEEDNIVPTLDQREEDRKTARNNPKPADFDKHGINRVRFINNYWSTKEFAMSSTDFDDFDDVLSDCLEESSPYANTVRGRLIKAKELLESIEKRQLRRKELNEMAKRYEQLGDDPLHACVEDHAKMYRHLLASKNAMEKIKQSDGIKAVIESIKDQMDSLMPKNKEFTDNNEKIYSAQQEFKNTIADQIADEQFEKFHRAQPKGNKSAKDIQKNCAAKILAVNILKNLDPQHEKSPADLFSAKNIKDVANAIKQTEWFKHQKISSLKNDVVDPGVIDGKVMEDVNNSLSALENNLQGKAVPQTGIIQDIINKHQQKDLLKK